MTEKAKTPLGRGCAKRDTVRISLIAKHFYSHGIQQAMIRQLLADKTSSIYVQLVRYTFVGGFAFVVDFSALFLLTNFFAVHYLISAAIAFVFGCFNKLYLEHFLGLSNKDGKK